MNLLRSSNRIKPFCNDLAKIWSKLPDLRFGQLTYNLAMYVKQTYGKDIFYIEDEELLKLLEEYSNR